MNKTLRTKSSNNRIVILLMIISLSAIFMSGCGQPAEPAKNAANTASNTTTKSPESDPALLEGYTGETKKQDLKNITLPFAKGQDLTVEVANDGTVIFERDMILGNISDFNKSDSPSNDADSSDKKPWMWSNSTIPYVLPEDHGKKDIILEGIKEINSKTNLCLVPRTTETDYVEFVAKSGNWSKVGRVGGRQEISINNNAVMGTVAHEILHAAGFSHMQSREYREAHVTINLDNIEPGKEHNFKRLTDTASNLGDYDFNSILHYSAYGFSKNGQKTIDIKGSGDSSNMGQRKALSTGDIASIAKIYTPGSCKSASESKTTATSTGTCGETPGDDEVYIYEHIFTQDGGGKCVKLQAGEYNDAAAMGLADNMMSSIKIGKNVHAVVCTDANFGGTCMAFDKDDDNFLNNATLKNDTGSSVKVAKAEVCSPQKADKPVTLKWTNKSDKNLRIVWINYECKERNEPREVERKIKPGDVMEEESFVSHIFHVTNFDTNESYGYIYVNESNAVHEIKDIK